MANIARSCARQKGWSSQRLPRSATKLRDYATDDARTGTACNRAGELDGRTIYPAGDCAPPAILDVGLGVDALGRIFETGDGTLGVARVFATDLSAHAAGVS
jgi:hypothetical protein